MGAFWSGAFGCSLLFQIIISFDTGFAILDQFKHEKLQICWRSGGSKSDSEAMKCNSRHSTCVINVFGQMGM